MAILDLSIRQRLYVGDATPEAGTARDDIKVFATGSHYYEGLAGNDVITGGLGNDYIEGGAGADTFVEAPSPLGGNDTLGYFNSNAGVTIVLNALGGLATAQGGHAQGDVAVAGFEDLVGSQFNDSLTANADHNTIFGMGGNDTMNGGGGNDSLYGGDGNDTLNGDAGNDTFHYSAGGDVVNGGAGIDTINFAANPGAGNGATINLKTGLGDHDAAGWQFTSVENVIGSPWNDDIWGNGAANVMDGGTGRDRFFYDDLADLNGDTFNAFRYNGEGDLIDLSNLAQRLSYSNIRGTYISTPRDGSIGIHFNINANGSTYGLDIYWAGDFNKIFSPQDVFTL